MLTIIQVGHNDASDRYVRNKVKAIKEAGLDASVVNLDESCTTFDVLQEVAKANVDSSCAAIMVQLPLPSHIDKDAVMGVIDPAKDIDGLNHKSNYMPLTPCAIMRWLSEQNANLEGANVAILGRSELVGKPLANMMIDAGATVTVMNSKTDLWIQMTTCKAADVIVSAVGKCGVVELGHVSNGYAKIVIDVGINRNENGKLCGDVSETARMAIEKYGGVCTPVPGGVGKWTVRELIIRLSEMEGWK